METSQPELALPTQLARYRDLLTQVLEKSVGDLPLVDSDGESAQHLAILVIYCTIVQSAQESAILFGQLTTAIVAGIIRSILESFADLNAVINKGSYAERMLATFHNEKIRLLKSMRRSPDNPFHIDLSGHINPESELPKVLAELHEITDRGHRPLQQDDRFSAAGPEVEHLYGTYYWQLCLQGHNNIAILEKRHITRVGDRLHVTIFAASDPEDVMGQIDSLTAILINSSIRVHSFFLTGRRLQFEKMLAALNALRDEAVGHSVARGGSS